MADRPASSSPEGRSDLLLALLAYQNCLLSREELRLALDKLSSGPARTPEGRLPAHVTAHQRQLLAGLLHEHTQRAEKQPAASLAEVSSIILSRVSQDAQLEPDLAERVQRTLLAAETPHPQATTDHEAETVTGAAEQEKSAAKVQQPQARFIGDSARFQILREHAEGGLGKVYVAHDRELNRDVALKEIKPGHVGDLSARRRFLREAEITGGLEHPGIVPVYSLGRYGDGRPYYAMRFISGQTLRDAIKSFVAQFGGRLSASAYQSLEFRQLLQRFVSVCNAVAYAHSRNVLHRDLKPANIMLGQFGETLVVDWGLAKGIDRHDEAGSDQQTTGRGPGETAMGATLGTLAYMSPEQASGRIDQFGPATDIYLLGGTLFHLLTGQPPHRGQKTEELLKSITTTDVGSPRREQPAIPPALAAVCQKALARDQANRYASAADLAADVECYLADEPVSAYREPIHVRVRRSLRKRPALTSGLTAALLVGLFALSIGSLLIGQKNRQLLTANSALTAEKNRLQLAMEFFSGAFRKPHPELDGREITAAELLLAAARDADTQMKSEPLLKAQLLSTIATTLHGLGLFEDQLKLAIKVRDTRREFLPEDDAQTLEAESLVAEAHLALKQPEQAIPLIEHTLARRRQVLGQHHPDALLAQARLASAWTEVGRLREAISLFRETLEDQQKLLGADHSQTLNTQHLLAGALLEAAELDEARMHYETVLKQRSAVLGAEHPATLAPRIDLTSLLVLAGKSEEALPLLEEALSGQRRQFGADHPVTLATEYNLALTLTAAGKHEEALKQFEQTLAALQKRFPGNNLQVLRCRGSHAGLLLNLGRSKEALPILQEVFAAMRDKLGADHPNTLIVQHNLAMALQTLGQGSQARDQLEEVLRRREKTLGSTHFDTLDTKLSLATCLQGLGQTPDALNMLEPLVPLYEGKLGAQQPRSLRCRNTLVLAYLAAGQLERAAKVAAQTRELLQRHLPPEHPLAVEGENNLANLHLARGELKDAERIHRELLKQVEEAHGVGHPHALTVQRYLAADLFRQGKLSEAQALYEETLAVQLYVLGANHPQTLQTQYDLGLTLARQQRLEEALPLFESAYLGQKDLFGITHASTCNSLKDLALAHWLLGHQEPALTHLEELHQATSQFLPAGHADLLMTEDALGEAYVAVGQFDKAEAIVKHTAEARRSKLGADRQETIATQLFLARILWLEGKFDEALALQEANIAAAVKALGAASPMTTECRVFESVIKAAREESKRLQSNLAFASQNEPKPNITGSMGTKSQWQQLNDGRMTSFLPSLCWIPAESRTESDWLVIEWREEKELRKIEIALRDEGPGGQVRPPRSIAIETWDGERWVAVTLLKQTPAEPTAASWNVLEFQPRKTQQVRITFQHQPKSKTGVSEIAIWP